MDVSHPSNNWAKDYFSTEIWLEFQKMKQNELTVLFFFGTVVYGIPQSAASPWGQLPLTVLKY